MYALTVAAGPLGCAAPLCLTAPACDGPAAGGGDDAEPWSRSTAKAPPAMPRMTMPAATARANARHQDRPPGAGGYCPAGAGGYCPAGAGGYCPAGPCPAGDGPLQPCPGAV